MAPLLIVSSAIAQSESKVVSSTFFDTVSQWLTFLGEKTEGVIAPRFAGFNQKGSSGWEGLKTGEREFEESQPARPTATISIANEFGEIRVSTWDNPVVQIKAHVLAGAENDDLARELSEAIKITVTPTPEQIEIRTEYPDTRDKGKVAMAVNYTVTIPSTANVICKNNFGDTIIANVGGTAAVDSRFGMVDLAEVSGLVTVRAWGEFPLTARGLRQGGFFQLQGTQAEFANVGGTLNVSSFTGSVTLRDLAPETDLDVTSESGPIHLYVPENAAPDVSATAFFGTVKSDTVMEQTSRGDMVVARSANVDAKQQVTLQVSFDTIFVHQEGLKPPPPPAVKNGGEYVTRSMEQAVEWAAGAEIVVEAVPGDVRIHGTDGNRVEIKATRVVRVASTANAQAAIEALGLTVEPSPERVRIATAVRDNLASLGCSQFRIDLDIGCPRGASLRVTAENGATSVVGMSSAIIVVQKKGSVSAESCKRETGTFELTNEAGDVTLTECQGPVTVAAQQGMVKSVNVYGKQAITAVQAKTLIESPKGEVVVRNRGADVSILALDGILGEYNVAVEKGTLNIVIPPSSDATLFVTAKNGQIRNTAITLNGTLEQQVSKFTGVLNNGTNRVELQTDGGDIYID
jgi:hypothetical protein